ncbi:hypothetical protein HWV62_823 [Athelia sp. TMB]|nr:hypothetical protein HWV62_823 [Athelia sp. TMB]
MMLQVVNNIPTFPSTSIDFSDSESTVTMVGMETTGLEVAQVGLIRELNSRIRQLERCNCDLNEMRDFWETEASKLADYVELGKLAIKRRREENRNLNARIRSLDNVNNSDKRVVEGVE